MRKLVLFFVVIQAASSFAAPLEPFTEVTKGITTYLPFVKMLVYILATLVGIAGGVFAAFIKMQDENANVKPYIVGTVASCFVLIASAAHYLSSSGMTRTEAVDSLSLHYLKLGLEGQVIHLITMG